MLDFTGVKTLTIPEGKVKKITRKSDGVVLWEKATGRIPSAYQEVEWIQAAANVGAYINLGFSYDTGATIHLGQYIMNDNTAYPFGAAENSGVLRCMFSFPYGNAATAYFTYGSSHQAVTVSYTKNILNEFVAQYKVGAFVLKNLTLGIEQKYASIISYTMTAPLYLFAQNYNGTARFGDIRRIAYFKYYDKTNTLICDLVPCYRKSDGVIGMYDLVKKTFFTNAGTGTFTKGADITYKNLADPTSADWLDNYRTSSSGIIETDGYCVTNYMGNGKCLVDQKIYYKNIKISNQRLAFYNKNKEQVYIAYPSVWGDKQGFDNNATEGYITVSLVNEALYNAYYVRLCGLTEYSNPIITINEEITP